MNKIQQIKVLSVGQCSADEPTLRRMLRSIGDIQVDQAHTADQAIQMMGREEYALVLINRILDATGEVGLDLITNALKTFPQQPLMLVSNYEEAQQSAVARGAIPGFGKNQIANGHARKVLASILTSPDDRK